MTHGSISDQTFKTVTQNHKIQALLTNPLIAREGYHSIIIPFTEPQIPIVFKI